MIHPAVRSRVQLTMEQLVRPLARRGIAPNVITLLGFLLSLVAGIAIWRNAWPWAGLLVLVASGFDMLDGALARVSGQKSLFGAFFDSTLDRLSEAAISAGLVALYLAQRNDLMVMLALGMLIGSQMVSYTRARAEGLGLECQVGLFQRPERIIALGLGLLIPSPLVLDLVVILLALLTLFTTAERIWHVWQATRT